MIIGRRTERAKDHHPAKARKCVEVLSLLNEQPCVIISHSSTREKTETSPRLMSISAMWSKFTSKRDPLAGKFKQYECHHLIRENTNI